MITISAWSIFGLGFLAGAPLWVFLTCLTAYWVGRRVAEMEKKESGDGGV